MHLRRQVATLALYVVLVDGLAKEQLIKNVPSIFVRVADKADDSLLLQYDVGQAICRWETAVLVGTLQRVHTDWHFQAHAQVRRGVPGHGCPLLFLTQGGLSLVSWLRPFGRPDGQLTGERQEAKQPTGLVEPFK